LERVQCIMRRYDSIKIKNTVFNGEFVAGNKRAYKSIATRNFEIYRCTDQREWYVSRVIEPILASLEEFQERDSGWALSRILNLTVNANKLNPLRAGCHIKLPEEIISKRAVINVVVPPVSAQDSGSTKDSGAVNKLSITFLLYYF
ncbi:hypothetical protein ALC62_11023, partial [Cyphomyrmex costatus]